MIDRLLELIFHVPIDAKLIILERRFSQPIDNLQFTTYDSITTMQYNMQCKTIEHNKQCELN